MNSSEKKLAKKLLEDCGLTPNTKFHLPMGPLTSLGTGGPIFALVESNDSEKIGVFLGYLEQYSLPWRVLGGGTNLLGDDRGISEVVFHIPPLLPPIKQKNHCLISGAGTSLARLLNTAQKLGLSGLEFCSGIPGTVGGALAMNAGTATKWISEAVEYVIILRPGQTEEKISKDQIKFDYRTSNLRNRKLIIMGACFRLSPASTSYISAQTKKIKKIRKEKLPVTAACAGCWFRNPPGKSAGRLIEQAGLKGLKQGNAQVSKHHANFIINPGGATSKDILELADHIREKVFLHSGVHLKTEVETWP